MRSLSYPSLMRSPSGAAQGRGVSMFGRGALCGIDTAAVQTKASSIQKNFVAPRNPWAALTESHAVHRKVA